MKIFKTILEYNNWFKTNNHTASLGLVPTMGALHRGHISLIQNSTKICSKTVVSIFVNPAQFNDKNDLHHYPDNLPEDIKVLKKLSVDILFVPNNNTMYPAPFSTWVKETRISRFLEGAFRPNHFVGVATVVLKLFNIIKPSHAFFGQKDIQQLKMVQALIHDLNYDIELICCATMRNKHGLALSSRNHLLSSKELNIASKVFHGLMIGKDNLKKGLTQSIKLKRLILDYWADIKGFNVEYLEIVEFESFNPIETIDQKSVLCCAVFIGKARLIDNLIVFPN